MRIQLMAMHLLLFLGENLLYLSCFFHIMKNVKENAKSLSEEMYSMVMRDVKYLHYSRSEEMFRVRLEDIDSKWRIHELRSFADYFKLNLIETAFSEWQAFHTPSG